MAGPTFDVILSLSAEADPESLARDVSHRALEHGYGVLFGKELLRCLDSAEGGVLDKLEEEMPNPLTMSITSGPLATDAWAIFEHQLNPWNNLNPERADFLGFLRELWSLNAVRRALFVVVERRIWSESNMPRRRLSFEQFLRHLEAYYRNSLKEAELGSVEGIFEVRKEQ